jgi:hypothetical protein
MDMVKGSIKDKGGISGMIENLQDVMPHLKGEKGKSAWNHLKQSVKHLPHNLFMPGMGLAGAGATALILNAGMRAKHKVERHIEENKENK